MPSTQGPDNLTHLGYTDTQNSSAKDYKQHKTLCEGLDFRICLVCTW
jgi:hypothetical protein